MNEKHQGGPAPVPPDNRPAAGPGHPPADEHAPTEHDENSGASFQEQDPKRRLGGFSGAGEHPIQQPTKKNDGA
ncbi:MAG: hypothetical protein MUF18_06640 [Fimbriiglobus sp.]|jgi:hypothetical protein|nr:hypothetical protein [Fimbriiglobus sp.]